VLSVLKHAEEGLIDLEEVSSFTYRYYQYYGPVLRVAPFFLGQTFSTRELVRRSISESHDGSTLMLNRILGLETYINFIREIGGNVDFVGNRIMDSFLTAEEAGLFARVIFEYLESGGSYSQMFKELLLDNYFPFITSNYPVASKTGWFSPYAWHDMSIVYAPSPFVLVILSAQGGWRYEDYADFHRISMAFHEFNERWFLADN
jgi:hypothetical protein